MTPYHSDNNAQIVIFNARWEDVWPTLGLKHEDVALLWADPPYGIDLSPFRGRGERVHGDDRPFDPAPLLAFPRSVLWGANHYAERLPSSPAWFVWDKREGVGQNVAADAELAWTNLPGVVRVFAHMWNGGARASEAGISRSHPTQKPVALATWGFQCAKLKPGDLVFSPYMGSGPEARAALDMGLRFIGCEIIEDYCKVAVSRLKQLPLFST